MRNGIINKKVKTIKRKSVFWLYFFAILLFITLLRSRILLYGNPVFDSQPVLSPVSSLPAAGSREAKPAEIINHLPHRTGGTVELNIQPRPGRIFSPKPADGLKPNNAGACQPSYFSPLQPGDARAPLENPPMLYAADYDTLNRKGLSTHETNGLFGRSENSKPDWLDNLIDKIWQVESECNLWPRDGDGGEAVGPLQIHQDALTDVNEYYGTNFTLEDMREIEKAKLVARLYMTMWLEKHKKEIAARIFNGGPRGWNKKTTDEYWEKIKRQKCTIAE